MMQTYQQGKAGAGKLRRRIISIIVVLIMLLGAISTLAGMRIIPAKAATSSYPYATMPCVWPPYATDGPKAYKYQNAWCKLVDKNGKIVSYDDWGTIPNNNKNKSEIDPKYGYAYRNCTDYVAWKVATLGVQPQQYKGLGNANKWPDNAPSHGLTVDTTPAVGSVAVNTSGQFGHVAFVEAVNPDGTIKVSEFNEYFDGDYNSRTVKPAKAGFTEFVHFEKYETGGGGKLIWRYQTGGQVGSSPAVVNGVVYIGSGDDYLYALNASNGTLLWSYQTGGAVSSPAVVNGVVYVSSGDDYLYALNASNGTLLWSYQTGGAVSSPAVANGVVYVGSVDYHVYALNASKGTLLWRYKTGSGVGFSPAVANGVVYVGSWDFYVYALNASNGTLLWRYPAGLVASHPTVINGVVYIGSDDDYLYALNASNGTLLWSYQTGNPVYSSPAVVNGIVYTGSYDGYVYALNTSKGTLLWRYQTGNGIESSPAVVNGVLYIGSNDDYVYALTA